MSETRQVSSRFLEMWANTVDEGLVPRMLITSNRHQMGKTNTMIRIQEKVQEEIHGRKFHIDDLTLTCLEFMQRRKAVGEWTPLGLDEPERPVGNKSNWDLVAQAFVEDLMTSPFRHIPAMFALPHAHYLNVSIYGIATSQIIKHSRSFCELYEYERDQLNRSMDTFTWGRGTFTIDPAYSWDWKDYIDKREAFDIKRGRELEEKVASLSLEVRQLDKYQVYQMVEADPKRFTDPRSGKITPSMVEDKLGVSFAAARFAAGKFNKKERELAAAEADKIGTTIQTETG
jgi:hypothetical protein